MAVVLAMASRIAARQAEGEARGEPVGGSGTPAMKPALSMPLQVWAALPSTGGRGITRLRANQQFDCPRYGTPKRFFWARWARDQITSASYGEPEPLEHVVTETFGHPLSNLQWQQSHLRSDAS